MTDTPPDVAIELTPVPAQEPDTPRFFDRIKNVLGDEDFERDFSLVTVDRYSNASLLTGGHREADRWSSWDKFPDSAQLQRLIAASESKHGILLIEEISQQWFEALDAMFGLDPSFVLAYSQGHSRLSDLQQRLNDSDAFLRGVKGIWFVRRGTGDTRPEDFKYQETGIPSSYWEQRIRRRPSHGALVSVAAFCQLSPSMLLIITEDSPMGSIPRSPNLLKSNVLDFVYSNGINTFSIPWSLEKSDDGYLLGKWYNLHDDLISILSNSSNETSSSNLHFNMLFGIGNASEPTYPAGARMRFWFEFLLQLTVPHSLQRTVSSLSYHLENARYEAQSFPSSDTYLPLLAIRRTLADLRLTIVHAKQDFLAIEKSFDAMQKQPKRSISTSFQHIDVVVDQMNKNLYEEIQLIIGAVTVQDADLARQQSDRATLLTLLAAIYLPLTLVTGIFGMNIRDIEDGKPKYWWCIIILIIIVALTAVAYLSFRWWQRGQRATFEQRRKDNLENGLWLSQGPVSISDVGEKGNERVGIGRISRLFIKKVK